MNAKIRFLVASFLTVVAAVLFWHFGLQRLVASPDNFASVYTGQNHISGPLNLDIDVSPAVSQAGDSLTINLNLQNTTASIASPEISIVLPTTVRLNIAKLARGTTFNVQSNSLSWQPVVTADGGAAQTAFNVTVNAIDPQNPEQIIEVTLAHGAWSQTADVVVWAGSAPQGRPLINPGRASVGQPVQLIGELTNGSGPITQVWASGDGRIIPADNPVIVYPAVGTYQVGLQVANPIAVHTSTGVIVIVPEPAAFLSTNDTTPAVGQAIQFMTQGGGQPPLDYIWDFGDGSFSAEPNPTHTYNAPGIYQVLHTVRNQFGQAQNYLPITVGNPPIADMEMALESAAAGQSIEGQAYTDDLARAIVWDMGDGSVYEGSKVNHAYRTAGEYAITMTASNEFGDTRITHLIRVTQDEYTTFLPVVVGDADAIFITEVETAAGGAPNLTATTIELIEVNAAITLEPNETVDALSPPEQLIWYINEARRQADLPPVALDGLLSTAAKIHTNDMAANNFTGHTGSDGSPPYERLARAGFAGGGYAGEATAWGYHTAREAVQFWLESPPHRAIILNPIATHVGVAKTTNYNAASVWYWTAEFASSYGSIESQMLQAGVRVTGPALGEGYEFGTPIPFTWVWPLPLDANTRFVVYARPLESEAERQIGLVTEPITQTLYGLSVLPSDISRTAGEFAWQVRLEDGVGNVLSKSELRPFVISGTLPTATPTLQPFVPPVATPTPVPAEPTFKPTYIAPTPTPQVTPPLLITQVVPTSSPTNASPTAVPPTATATASMVSLTATPTVEPTATPTAPLVIVTASPQPTTAP